MQTALAERIGWGQMNPNEDLSFYDQKAIEIRFAEAVEVLRSLREPTRPAGFRSNMPEIVRTFWEAYNMEAPRRPRKMVTHRQVSRMEECIEWLWLVSTARRRKLLLVRATGFSWRKVGRICGCSHELARLEHHAGVEEILRVVNRTDYHHISRPKIRF